MLPFFPPKPDLVHLFSSFFQVYFLSLVLNFFLSVQPSLSLFSLLLLFFFSSLTLLVSLLLLLIQKLSDMNPLSSLPSLLSLLLRFHRSFHPLSTFTQSCMKRKREPLFCLLLSVSNTVSLLYQYCFEDRYNRGTQQRKRAIDAACLLLLLFPFSSASSLIVADPVTVINRSGVRLLSKEQSLISWCIFNNTTSVGFELLQSFFPSLFSSRSSLFLPLVLFPLFFPGLEPFFSTLRLEENMASGKRARKKESETRGRRTVLSLEFLPQLSPHPCYSCSSLVLVLFCSSWSVYCPLETTCHMAFHSSVMSITEDRCLPKRYTICSQVNFTGRQCLYEAIEERAVFMVINKWRGRKRNFLVSCAFLSHHDLLPDLDFAFPDVAKMMPESSSLFTGYKSSETRNKHLCWIRQTCLFQVTREEERIASRWTSGHHLRLSSLSVSSSMFWTRISYNNMDNNGSSLCIFLGEWLSVSLFSVGFAPSFVLIDRLQETDGDWVSV